MTKAISLNIKCPYCNESVMDNDKMLMDKPSIKLNIETASARGTIRLCSIYGCYNHEADIEIADQEFGTDAKPNEKMLFTKMICSHEVGDPQNEMKNTSLD